ncbi:hypothetical protein CC78DRAFT_574275 [Lojkania enalia]|uniref:Uncharacterized protein n=1 Tax=Lojkania enalia TaxID=147567 RepID=A0A9P4NBL0_9PLEO|nr:hypothetical protein CC78DRAFT_574275 [Didymosphaeria enalia]
MSLLPSRVRLQAPAEVTDRSRRGIAVPGVIALSLPVEQAVVRSQRLAVPASSSPSPSSPSSSPSSISHRPSSHHRHAALGPQRRGVNGDGVYWPMTCVEQPQCDINQVQIPREHGIKWTFPNVSGGPQSAAGGSGGAPAGCLCQQRGATTPSRAPSLEQ